MNPTQRRLLSNQLFQIIKMGKYDFTPYGFELQRFWVLLFGFGSSHHQCPVMYLCSFACVHQEYLIDFNPIENNVRSEEALKHLKIAPRLMHTYFTCCYFLERKISTLRSNKPFSRSNKRNEKKYNYVKHFE